MNKVLLILGAALASVGCMMCLYGLIKPIWFITGIFPMIVGAVLIAFGTYGLSNEVLSETTGKSWRD